MATLRTILRHAAEACSCKAPFSQRAWEHPALGGGFVVEHAGSAIFVPGNAPAPLVADWVDC